MKKVYTSPVAEKLEFDYTNVVATSVGGATQTATTVDHKCVVIVDTNLLGTPDTGCVYGGRT